MSRHVFHRFGSVAELEAAACASEPEECERRGCNRRREEVERELDRAWMLSEARRHHVDRTFDELRVVALRRDVPASVRESLQGKIETYDALCEVRFDASDQILRLLEEADEEVAAGSGGGS